MLKATDEWQEIESPGYPDPGYESGEKCSWLIEAAVGTYITFLLLVLLLAYFFS